MASLAPPAILASPPPTPRSDLPRWMIAVFVSGAAHAALAGGWLAYAWAVSQLSASSHQGAARAEQIVVGELLTRRTSPAPSPQGVAASAQRASASVPSEQGGGGRGGYFARLREHLAAFRRPLQASTGVARVRFHVEPDGSVGGIELAQTSGIMELDAEALALVARAAPVPRPPQAMTVLVPVEFR